MSGANIHPVMTPPELAPVPEATLGDLLVQLRRIADAFDAQNPHCEATKGQAVCFLLPIHVGYHVTADGRHHWLDDE